MCELSHRRGDWVRSGSHPRTAGSLAVLRFILPQQKGLCRCQALTSAKAEYDPAAARITAGPFSIDEGVRSTHFGDINIVFAICRDWMAKKKNYPSIASSRDRAPPFKRPPRLDKDQREFLRPRKLGRSLGFPPLRKTPPPHQTPAMPRASKRIDVFALHPSTQGNRESYVGAHRKSTATSRTRDYVIRRGIEFDIAEGGMPTTRH